MWDRAGVPPWAVLLAGAMLAWPAAWNGYPLVFADTGTYLGQAIMHYLGWDRPPFYSLFLHALHWRVTLWTVPLAQGLIAAHLIALVLRVLDRLGPGPLLAAAAALAAATGLPWFAAQLMPDVFTGLLVLALWLLGFAGSRIGRFERIYLFLFSAGAIACHLTHLPLSLGLALVGGGVAALAAGPAGGLRTAGRMAAPAALALAALLAANGLAHKRLAVSPFGSVFLAARLIEDGPALHALDAHCAVERWQVCALRAQLPVPANDFLWPPDGPLRGVLGGGKAWAAEASEIVSATLEEAPLGVAAAALRNALVQFGMLATGDGLNAWRGEPGPEPLIRTFFPREAEPYAGSRQSAGRLRGDAAAVAPLHVTLAWAGLFALPLVALARWRQGAAFALCVLVLAAGLGNAVLTGALSGPNERYQARIAWLFAFAPAAVLAGARQPRRAALGALDMPGAHVAGDRIWVPRPRPAEPTGSGGQG
jgi:hypothetical protein